MKNSIEKVIFKYNIKYERINFEFPYPIQHIVDFNFTCGYGKHPRLHLIGMVLEQDRDTILEKANSETAITLRDNKGKLLFHGYATNIQFRLEGGLHYLHLEAEGASSKLDIAKRSRTFFKQGITYKEIIKTVLKSYPGAGIDAHVKLDRKADFPIIQYQETDWEFLCRLASLFEAAILPDETATAPILEIGWKRKDSKEFLEINEITTVRDVLTYGKNFYGKDEQFSIKEKEQEEKYGEEYRFLLSAMPPVRMPDVINYTTKAFQAFISRMEARKATLMIMQEILPQP